MASEAILAENEVIAAGDQFTVRIGWYQFPATGIDVAEWQSALQGGSAEFRPTLFDEDLVSSVGAWLAGDVVKAGTMHCVATQEVRVSIVRARLQAAFSWLNTQHTLPLRGLNLGDVVGRSEVTRPAGGGIPSLDGITTAVTWASVAVVGILLFMAYRKINEAI